jgi:NADP-dependent 3-hydroxy acid dehydrogenase YdfG
LFPRAHRLRSRHYNICTTVISPGAVPTELTETITDPQVAAGVRQVHERAIPAGSFARAVVFAVSQPSEADVNEILYRPTSQVF